MRALRYALSALNDLDAIADYVESESASPPIARALIDRLQSRCERLAELPGMLGQDRAEIRPGIRSTPEGNYIIFFRYDGDCLDVIAVVDAHRELFALFEDRS